MKFANCLVVCAVGMLFAAETLAQQNDDCPVQLEEAEHLTGLREAARIFVDLKRCQAVNESEAGTAYANFLNASIGWFDKFGGFSNSESPIEYIKSIISQTGNKSVTATQAVNDNLLIEGKEFVPANLEECERVAGEACGNVIYEFTEYYGIAHHEYTKSEILPVKKYIEDLREEWEPFLQTMRSQTAMELALNGWWFRRDESDDFESPPDMQWIVLHPIILLEYVDEAKDGDQMDEAVGLEIFGANWWKQDKWYVPSGGSVLALYSDREDVKDWGYGLAIHFKSSYTLGYTRHGSDDGIFISIDLLKAFHDKQKVFNSFFDESRSELR